MSPIYVNTSNPGKLAEYEEYFKPRTVVSQKLDIDEPDSNDPLIVIQYKASQFDQGGVLVDDVALDVEGADIGLKIRWLLNDLPHYIGRKCTYVCRIAIKVDNVVKVYLGSVEGQLVPPKGDCFGFGRYFLPDGTDQTLGENMAPAFNARYLAIQKFKEDAPITILPVLKVWEGTFQKAS